MNRINPNKKGLYIKFLVRMYLAWKTTPGATRKSYLDFNSFRKSICRTFSIPKEEAFEYLRIFQELDFITFVPCKGIKLNYTLEEGNE